MNKWRSRRTGLLGIPLESSRLTYGGRSGSSDMNYRCAYLGLLTPASVLITPQVPQKLPAISNDLGGMTETFERSEIIQAKVNYFDHNRKVFQGLLMPVLVTPYDPGRCLHKTAFSSHISGMHCFCWELKLSLCLQSLLRVSASPHACASYFSCHVWMLCWMMILCQVTLCLEICEKTDCNIQCHFFISFPQPQL